MKSSPRIQLDFSGVYARMHYIAIRTTCIGDKITEWHIRNRTVQKYFQENPSAYSEHVWLEHSEERKVLNTVYSNIIHRRVSQPKINGVHNARLSEKK